MTAMRSTAARRAVFRTRGLAAGLLAAMLLCGSVAAQTGEAPDGRPGFGREAGIKDVRDLFQSPSDEQRAFLESLQALEPDVRVLAVRFAKRYEDEGYMELCGRRGKPAEQSLEDLHQAWFDRAADRAAALREDRGRGAVFARLCCDLRFRVRARLLSGLPLELHELNGSLALLRAHFAGTADLRDSEVAQLGRRADLAAARLRAMRFDLDALREDEEPDAEALAVLSAAASGKGADPAAVERVLAELDRREAQMVGLLFSSRPSPALTAELDWRDRQRQAAERKLAEARELLPEGDDDAPPPADVKKLSKSKRYMYAGRAAIEGLDFDLIDEELNWIAGVSTDFQLGVVESRRWFDRFLALRGIRGFDSRSYEYNKLDDREKLALERVQTPIEVPR
jgi:hypothetical protein